MNIYNKNNYIPNFYNTLPNNLYYNFLKENCAHIAVDNDVKFLRKNFNKHNLNLNNVSEKIYSLIDKKSYSSKLIKENIFKANKQQFKKLSKNNFEINFPSTIEKKGIKKKAILNYSNKKMTNRNLVIYFRGPWRDFQNTAGMDIYHTIILYKVLELMIKNKNLSFFNKLTLVQSDPELEEIEPFKNASIKVNKCSGSNFLNETCLYANTIHINGGELPDAFSFTIPLLSIAFPYFNDYKLPEYNKDLLIEAIYPEIKFNPKIEYCDDLEKFYNGSLSSWKAICQYKENINKIKNQTNYINVFRYVENVVKVVYNLEEYLKWDTRLLKVF